MSTDSEEKNDSSSSSSDDTGTLRHSLRFVMLAWIFGAVWLYITTGAVLTRYAQLMNLSKFGFGLLAALPFAATLVQLPTSYVIERFGHQKILFITAGIIHRFLWVLMALIPWFVSPTAGWIWLLALICLSSMAAHIATPVWYSWMGDLVPTRIRGRFFSRRNQLGQFIGLFVTLLIGVVLDRAGAISPEALRNTISVALAIAGVFGMVDFLFFLPVASPSKHAPNPKVELWQMIRQPLMDRNFLRFMGFTASMTFATGYIGQFVWLYLFDVVGMSNTQANLLLVVIPLVVMMLILPLWGRVIDRFGCKPVLIICGLMIVNGATAWAFVTRELWWPGYIPVIISIVAWPGVELANFNILLGMSESMSGRRYGTAYIAILSVVTALAGVLSGLFGGIVAEWLGNWKGSIFGWPLTYHGVLFFISAGLRLAALGWLVKLEDRHAHSTRSTFRYLAVTLYSNLQQAVVVPIRMVIHVGRLTYKLNPVRPTARTKGQKEESKVVKP
jgi:MFS family permease